MMVLKGGEPGEPAKVCIEGTRGESEQRPQQRHVHSREQQPHNAGGGPVAAAHGIPAEGGQPYKETGEEKHPFSATSAAVPCRAA